jgi:hypothetical protein
MEEPVSVDILEKREKSMVESGWDPDPDPDPDPPLTARGTSGVR